jgi:polyphosphate glucokinase
MTENTSPAMAKQKILSIDIGGSNVKATLLDEDGQCLMEYEKLPTPVPATPERVMVVIEQLAQRLTGYDKISAGFPGYVKDGVVHTAPNLGTDYWKQTNLAQMLLHAWVNRPGW